MTEEPTRQRSTGRLRVLHVTGAMGGGITTALEQYASATPELEHFLVFSKRGRFDTGAALASFARCWDAGHGATRLYWMARRVARRVVPDIVHLHSAEAGVMLRAFPLGLPVPLVYSPHSYFFERTSAPSIVRRLARLAERALARRALTVTLTPHESQLANALGSRSALVPNTISLPPLAPATHKGDSIIGVGRVSAQKDPDFFIQVKLLVDKHRPHLPWIWFGAGDSKLEARLRAAGVEVAGWTDRTQVLSAMQTCALYLHTASWEGSPMTLLEAEAIGAPTVVRSIPALASLGYPQHLTTSQAVAHEVLRVLDGQQPARSGSPAMPVDTGRSLRAAYEFARSR